MAFASGDDDADKGRVGETVRTHESALATARAEIAAVAQTVSASHAKAEEATTEATRYKDNYDIAIAEMSR